MGSFDDRLREQRALAAREAEEREERQAREQDQRDSMEVERARLEAAARAQLPEFHRAVSALVAADRGSADAAREQVALRGLPPTLRRGGEHVGTDVGGRPTGVRRVWRYAPTIGLRLNRVHAWEHAGWELWVHDGSSAGTLQISLQGAVTVMDASSLDLPLEDAVRNGSVGYTVGGDISSVSDRGGIVSSSTARLLDAAVTAIAAALARREH